MQNIVRRLHDSCESLDICLIPVITDLVLIEPMNLCLKCGYLKIVIRGQKTVISYGFFSNSK